MVKNIENGILYYTFDLFSDTKLVKHCFSTKIGGVSKGDTATMNFDFKKSDKAEIVLENYSKLCKTLNLTYEGIILPNQTHSTNIKIVSFEDRGFLKNSNLDNTDGIITDKVGIVLATLYADCVSLYFFDPVKKVIGLSHAGWRGTVNNIGLKTIDKMISIYNCNIKNILVGIGPSIGQCCFEVCEDVKNEFEIKISFSYKYIKNSSVDDKKYKIDLWGINKELLINQGILEKNIEVANICTKCNSNIFYSHRVMGIKRGCMVAMLELIKK